MRTPLLVDSNYLYALHDKKDPHYPAAHAFASVSARPLLVADVVVGEASFLIKRSGGIPGLLGFLDYLMQDNITLLPIIKDYLRRVRQIEATYASAELDFVDCCIMALSERLNITQVCTFDRRDFAIFRPNHIAALELLP